MISAYCRLMRLDKPIGIALLLWPTLWALWLAYDGSPPFKVVIIFIVGSIFMRSAGCIINDIADRNVDGKVMRTCERPLVTGEVTLKQAIILFVILLALSASLLLLLKISIFIWAFIGALLAIIYPFCKRFLATPQFILGFAFSWGIPIVFIQAEKIISKEVLILMLANFLWIICYDTFYAMVDKKDDLLIGVKSTAIFFGKHTMKIIGLLQLIIAGLWLFIAHAFHLSMLFYIAYLFAQSLFIFQHFLASKHEREFYFKAFLNNNWYGLMMFLAIVMGTR